MFKSAERFAELHERLGGKVEMFEGIPWVEYNKMVVPVGPVKLNYSISKEKASFLLSKFPDALLVRCADGFENTNCCKEWYAVICDKFSELNVLSGNTRSKIKRGFKNCAVKRVDSNFIAEHGFNVFISAFKKYRGVKKPDISEMDFKKRGFLMKQFDDIVHHWCVFHKNKMIAYSVNYIYDDIEANYSTIKFHADFLKLYPAYALFYTMNKYYLNERKFWYVNDGFRNILHQTNIQEFLIDKFKFTKVYTKLYLFYKPNLAVYLSASYPLRNFIGKISPKLAALYKLEEIRRNYKNSSNN